MVELLSDSHNTISAATLPQTGTRAHIYDAHPFRHQVLLRPCLNANVSWPVCVGERH